MLEEVAHEHSINARIIQEVQLLRSAVVHFNITFCVMLNIRVQINRYASALASGIYVVDEITVSCRQVKNIIIRLHVTAEEFFA